MTPSDEGPRVHVKLDKVKDCVCLPPFEEVLGCWEGATDLYENALIELSFSGETRIF